MIPKIIHNIWIKGYENMPEEIKKKQLFVKKINPEWEFIVWDHSAILKLLKKYPDFHSMYKRLHKYIPFEPNSPENHKEELNRTKNNMIKYLILKEYGGVYYDIQLSCLFNFNEIFEDMTLDKENRMYLVKNNNFYSNYLYYIYPFFNETEINTRFMAFSKNHPIWENIFSKLKSLRSEKQMNAILDDMITCGNDYSIVYLIKKGDCFQKTNTLFSRSSFFFNRYFQIFHCYYKQIYLLIMVCLSVYFIHHITVFNSQNFVFPLVVPFQLLGETKGETKGEKKSKTKSKK
jgi:mannosyltransferase OCH1-like enzyme